MNILLVEDHHMVRFGTRLALEGMPGWRVVGETGDGPEAIEMVKHLAPDLVLLDLSLRGLHGLEVLQAIKRQHAEVRVLVVTAYEAEHLARAALEGGADGYVLKDLPLEEYLAAIRAVVAGERYVQATIQQKLTAFGGAEGGLSDREKQILAMVSDGLENRAIGEQLRIRPRTVEYHLSNIYSKLGATNRTEAVRLAREQGWLH